MGEGVELQLLRLLDVFQQGGFGLYGLLPAGLGGLGALHHLGGLVADVAPVGPQAGVPAALLGGLNPVRPGGGAPGGVLQPADLLFQLRVLRQLKRVLPLPVFIP